MADISYVAYDSWINQHPFLYDWWENGTRSVLRKPKGNNVCLCVQGTLVTLAQLGHCRIQNPASPPRPHTPPHAPEISIWYEEERPAADQVVGPHSSHLL